VAAKKKRKRKRKSRYHTGIHISPKCKEPIKYRSSWEKTTAQHLDFDPLVEKYEYESLKIPYISNKKTKKTKNYIPDFLVYYVDGRKVLIEVKRVSALNQRAIVKKAEAAREWASKNDCVYCFWTDNIIKALKKIQKAHEK
jgi:hypothetical protein